MALFVYGASRPTARSFGFREQWWHYGTSKSSIRNKRPGGYNDFWTVANVKADEYLKISVSSRVYVVLTGRLLWLMRERGEKPWEKTTWIRPDLISINAPSHNFCHRRLSWVSNYFMIKVAKHESAVQSTQTSQAGLQDWGGLPWLSSVTSSGEFVSSSDGFRYTSRSGTYDTFETISVVVFLKRGRPHDLAIQVHLSNFKPYHCVIGVESIARIHTGEELNIHSNAKVKDLCGIPIIEASNVWGGRSNVLHVKIIPLVRMAANPGNRFSVVFLGFGEWRVLEFWKVSVADNRVFRLNSGSPRNSSQAQQVYGLWSVEVNWSIAHG